LIYLLKWPFPSVTSASIILEDAPHEYDTDSESDDDIWYYHTLVEYILGNRLRIPIRIQLSLQHLGMYIVGGAMSYDVRLFVATTPTASGMRIGTEFEWDGREVVTQLGSGDRRVTSYILFRIFASKGSEPRKTSLWTLSISRIDVEELRRLAWVVLWNASKLWPSLVKFGFHSRRPSALHADAPEGPYLQVLLCDREESLDPILPDGLDLSQLKDVLSALPANMVVIHD
jgi:hypothetical protein